jgi:hypothetical protein
MPVRRGFMPVKKGRAALLGVVAHELGAFVRYSLEVWRFADPETLLVTDQLHPADVAAHDE